MTRGNVIYENTIMYKLVHKDDFNNDNIYIGHTTNFIKRKYAHKNRCNDFNDKEHNHKKYIYIRENGGFKMWDMIEIERYPCINKREADCRERELIDFYKSKLNTKLPFVSEEESKQNLKIYKEKNKEIISEKNKKKYKERNTEEIKLYQRKYRENNKEIILEKSKKYREGNKQYLKKYREENTQYQKEYQKKYREENKQYQKEYQKKYREEKKK